MHCYFEKMQCYLEKMHCYLEEMRCYLRKNALLLGESALLLGENALLLGESALLLGEKKALQFALKKCCDLGQNSLRLGGKSVAICSESSNRLHNLHSLHLNPTRSLAHRICMLFGIHSVSMEIFQILRKYFLRLYFGSVGRVWVPIRSFY